MFRLPFSHFLELAYFAFIRIGIVFIRFFYSKVFGSGKGKPLAYLIKVSTIEFTGIYSQVTLHRICSDQVFRSTMAQLYEAFALQFSKSFMVVAKCNMPFKWHIDDI